MDGFTWPVRIYYEDTDAGGVVYYANYLRFMERARTEWLRSMGFEQDVLREQGFLFAVKRVNIDYHLPARFNQYITIHSRIAHIGKARLTFEQTAILDNVCLTSATIEVVCLDAERFKPVAIPQLLREELQRVS